MNSKLFIFVSCFFLFSQVQSQTDQNSFELLKDLYLKKFVKDAAKTSFDSWVVDLEVDAVEFKADYIHEKDRVNLRLGYGERELLLHMFEDFQEPSSTLQNHDIAHHLQVFQTKNAPHLYSQVFPNATILGEVYGAYQLLNGARNNKHDIIQRQHTIMYLTNKPDVRVHIGEFLGSIKLYEELMLRNFDARSVTKGSSKGSGYDLNLDSNNLTNFPSGLAHESNLTAKAYSVHGLPEIFISTYWPAVVSAVSFASLVDIWKKPASTKSCGCFSRSCCGSGVGGAASVGFGALFAAQTVVSHHASMAEDELLTEQLLALGSVLEEVSYLLEVTNLPNNLKPRVPRDSVDDIKTFVALASSLTLQEGSNFFQWNLAKVRAARDLFLKLQPVLEKLLYDIGEIDFYYSVARVKANVESGFSYAKILEQDEFVIEAENLKNPLLKFETLVGNNFYAGTEEHPEKYVLLTGENYSGKSTMQRAVAINMLYLAQTLGLSLADSLVLTPVSAMHVYMTTEEDQENGLSSHKLAEKNLNSAYILHKKLAEKNQEYNHAALFVDEILSTTNAKKALRESREKMVDFAKLDNSMGIVSTHLVDLIHVDKESDNIRNYHMKEFKYFDGPRDESNAVPMWCAIVGDEDDFTDESSPCSAYSREFLLNELCEKYKLCDAEKNLGEEL